MSTTDLSNSIADYKQSVQNGLTTILNELDSFGHVKFYAYYGATIHIYSKDGFWIFTSKGRSIYETRIGHIRDIQICHLLQYGGTFNLIT